MRNKLLALTRFQKRLVTLSFDILLIWFSLFTVYCFRFGFETLFANHLISLFQMCLLAPVIALPVYIRMGLYRAVLRYMGPQVSFTILRASLFSFLGLTAAIFLLDLDDVPRSVPALYWLVSALLLGLSRYAARYWLMGYRLKDIMLSTVTPSRKKVGHKEQGVPVAIYGAGEAGAQLVESLDNSREYRPVAFIDDDAAMHGRFLAGKQVYSPDCIEALVEENGAEEFLLAIPSAKRQRRQEIVKSLECFGLPIKTIPGIKDLASGRFKMQEIQDVDIGDVLGREEVKPIQELIEKHITGRVVMVTGAGGSIGSEMARQALVRKPTTLILLEHSEYNLYAIDRELQTTIRKQGVEVRIVAVLGSINDPARLVDVMRTYKVETLYHAAAYKHVPMVQYNVSQGLRNNVLGTLYTAQAAIACGVKNFVLISTDKAVRPTNVMGASKRLAEMVLQALSNEGQVPFYHAHLFGLEGTQTVANNTRFTMVRFGNVLGSSGSVIPVFREQIRLGGPVTVTHPEINRYFMTIPEAAQLVIQAGAMGQGGDVFVLEMGKPVKIVDLAKRMVSLSGLTVKDEYNPDGDIEIAFSGLRPGEKLYEELLIGDNVTETDHPRICRATEEMLPWLALHDALNQIMATLGDHRYKITRELLLRYVNGYRPSGNVVDWLYKQPEHAVEPDQVA
ncbi:polysaccharide biosynthesis protein [Endozoicomonas gorgoniicola]|uniref:Polysaccharide biosynthesis protein n=1 Tax=Endozoicomonas gorgoniicola TaxID=1234144 RepID=A0ABT3MVZ1_9GAMM|nr:nucleoside-diphosphate sugar epimerase/dehydratase [Endozoicomonas gorgoniicola]MCW7553169.1 polysaccharide biosynthesis protein [Endozoicomonas gorgoniicola]